MIYWIILEALKSRYRKIRVLALVMDLGYKI